MRVASSLLLSIAASFLGTYLLRQIVSVEGGAGKGHGERTVVVVIPMVIGNRWIIGNQARRGFPTRLKRP